MKLRNFSLFIVSLFVEVFLFGAGDVRAQACNMGALSGTCESSCGSTSIDVMLFLPYFSGKVPVVCTGKVCCTPRGQTLCSNIEAANTKVPVSLVGNFKCVKSCASGSLTEYGISIETCTAGEICCSNPTPEEGSPCLQAAKKKLGFDANIHSSVETHCQLKTKDCESGYTLIGEDPTLCGQANLKCCAKKLQERAGTGGSGSPTTLKNPLGEGATLYTIIHRVIQAFLGIVGAAALLVFVYAGVMWMTAGSSDRVQKAKDAMKSAVIGLFIIAFAYGISSFIVDALIGNIQSQPQATPEYATPAADNL